MDRYEQEELTRVDGQPVIRQVEQVIAYAKCPHAKRTGGNDYIACDDCGLMWDYRREQPADAVVRLLAALQPPPVPDQGWRDIATAPKDGTWVLIWQPDNGMNVACWLEGRNAPIDWWFIEDGKNGPYAIRGAAPTHWMPLPDPPVERER